jgi:hypothetical protein
MENFQKTIFQINLQFSGKMLFRVNVDRFLLQKRSQSNG